MKGVIRTRVGYAGGILENPTYHNLGDHSEAIQIDYDPNQISYKELLNVFWKSHTPTYEAWSRQYMPALFYHNEEQKQFALETKTREEARLNKKIYTPILPYTMFYQAEDYHQKYTLQNRKEFMREFKMMYPTFEDFVNSTAAARVNGYLAGDGSYERLQAEIESLGLSEAAKQKLLTIVNP
jgi:methionine-S-sulfoxide reductase